jgi:hypothetical protein
MIGFLTQDLNFVRNRQSDTWEKVNLLRDKFEYDRERRMKEKGKLKFLLVALTKTTSQILVVPIYNFSQRTFLMKF